MFSKYTSSKIKKLETELEEAKASFNALFQEPDGKALKIRDINSKEFLACFYGAMKAVSRDMDELRSNASSLSRAERALSDGADSVDHINLLASLYGDSFEVYVESAIFDVFVARGFLCADDSLAEVNKNASLIFLLKHADRFYSLSASLIADYITLLDAAEKKAPALSRIDPAVKNIKIGKSPFKLSSGKLAKGAFQKLKTKTQDLDPFRIGRAFRYMDGAFHKANMSSIRQVSQFYGYPQAKRRFREYFEFFSQGKSNLPLLISSLPGLGKTHFTISYALSYDNLTLILPEPEYLERKLEELIGRLSMRKNRKFVLFFDDVNTDKVDWYYFRMNIGGSFSLPENIAIVIASNHRFPANISSRGRGFEFPMFDEINCQEMIHDYLASLGMRKPPAELVSVIAADYVEEFGQKMFEELSPRTLARYLDRYNNDAAKRKRMLDVSHEEVVARPDSQVFYEVNIKLLRDLYGEEVIDELRKQQLGE